MSEIARAYVTVGLKDDVTQGLGAMQSSLQRTSQRMSGAGMAMTKGLTVPILAAGAAAFGLASKYAQMGDDIAKTSTKLGVTTDALQEMQYWASQNGMEAATLERAVGRLNQRIGRAAEGNEKYADAFKALGVSLRDTSGQVRATEEVLGDTIEKLREIEDPAIQSARASEIFGTKMARDLMPALQDTSLSLEEAKEKIHELGGVMSEDAIRNAEKYEDAMDDLKRSFGGVFMELAGKLIPIFTDTLIPIIQDQILPVLRFFVNIITGLVKVFGMLPGPIQGLSIAFLGLVAAAGPMLLIGAKLVQAYATLQPAIAALSATKMGALVPAFVASTKAAWAFTAALLANPITWVVVAIVALIAIIVLLAKNWEVVAETLSKGWALFTEGIQIAWSAIKNFFSNLWEWLESFLAGWGPKLLLVIAPFIALPLLIWKNWEKIEEWFAELWDNVKGIFRSALQWFQDLPGRFLQWGKDIIDNIWEGIKAAWQRVKDGVGNIAQAIKDFFNPFAKSSPSLVELVEKGAHKIAHEYRAIEPPRREAGEAVLAGGGGTVNNFNLSDVHVRDDRDIERIARELYNLQRRKDRGVG